MSCNYQLFPEFSSRSSVTLLRRQTDTHVSSPGTFTSLVQRWISHWGYFVEFLLQWPGFQVDRTTNGVWSLFLIRGNCISCFSLPLEEMYTWKRGAFVNVRQYGHCGPDSLKVCSGNNVHFITKRSGSQRRAIHLLCAVRGKLITVLVTKWSLFATVMVIYMTAVETS